MEKPDIRCRCQRVGTTVFFPPKPRPFLRLEPPTSRRNGGAGMVAQLEFDGSLASATSANSESVVSYDGAIVVFVDDRRGLGLGERYLPTPRSGLRETRLVTWIRADFPKKKSWVKLSDGPVDPRTATCHKL